MAFSISMTTKIDSEIVLAVLAVESEKMAQPPEMSGKAVEQRWKCVCKGVSKVIDTGQ